MGSSLERNIVDKWRGQVWRCGLMKGFLILSDLLKCYE